MEYAKDGGFYFELTEGLFNKNANEKVSSNRGHRSHIGRLKLDRGDDVADGDTDGGGAMAGDGRRS